MDPKVITYGAYILISALLTVWVARTLHKNGRVFLVEVFGGDAVIREDGKPMIIDINAWPSYARYRDRAAQAIADHLAERFERRVRIVSRQGVES